MRKQGRVVPGRPQFIPKGTRPPFHSDGKLPTSSSLDNFESDHLCNNVFCLPNSRIVVAEEDIVIGDRT